MKTSAAHTIRPAAVAAGCCRVRQRGSLPSACIKRQRFPQRRLSGREERRPREADSRPVGHGQSQRPRLFRLLTEPSLHGRLRFCGSRIALKALTIEQCRGPFGCVL
ncbi:hypothetical protein MRX96_003699 [Rhipicephalus microplus]